MGRWVPDAPGRLMDAAMDLFSERGFEQTTVAEIAARAGLTERTFFRYFPDKREVLFFGSEALKDEMVRALVSVPTDHAPIDAIVAALERTAGFFEDRRVHARRRRAIIEANPELQERERNKLADISAAFAAALCRRGTKNGEAVLAAEIGIAIFRIAFERWLTDPESHAFSRHLRESLEELKAVTSGHL